MNNIDVTFPPSILYFLRDLTFNNPDRNENELTEMASNIIPSLMQVAKYQWSGNSEELKNTITKIVNSYRNKPIGPVKPSDEFKPDWMNDIDRNKWKYWPNLVQFLSGYVSPKRSSESIASLDTCSDDVLKWVGSPNIAGVRKGLVLGYVQSGKTQNFTALITKAADCGYKFFIVLSGIDNEIRKQTQQRIRRDILGHGAVFSEKGVPIPNPKWEYFTDKDNDFRRPPVPFKDIIAGNHPCCLVVKKHAGILKKVIDWIGDESSDANFRNNIPVLIIDDEADQASPDTNDDDDLNPTKINGRIREIIQLFPQSSRYVAYTATPFANFFINNEAFRTGYGADLFPEDFVRVLPLPPGYLGTADIYGLPPGVLRDGIEVNELGITETVTDTADSFGLVDSANVPCGLRKALICYYISSSIFIHVKGNSEPCTMLVHVSHLNDDQNDNESTVLAALNDFRAAALSINGLNDLKTKFHEIYKSEYLNKNIINYAEEFPNPKDIDFETLWDIIYKLISDNEVELKVVNGKRDSAPDFESENSPDRSIKAIYVGGNLLSRGLTIKNLLVSYFIRKSTQADTLLQMARWLGYRKNYAHIMKVFTTAAINNDMKVISGIEQDVRNQISEMLRQNKTPREFAIFVRTRVGLLPTAKNKMKHTNPPRTRRYGFESQLIENKVFPENNESEFNSFVDRIDSNHMFIRDLLQNNTRLQIEGSNWSKFNIDGPTAVNLIEKLQFDSRETYLGTTSYPDKISLIQYIKEKQKLTKPELTNWEIIVTSLTQGENRLDQVEFLKGGFKVTPIERGREVNSDERTFKISNLSEGKDEYDASSAEERQKILDKGLTRTNGSKIRQLRSKKIGRIFIYPISIFSNNEKYNKRQRSGVQLFEDNLYEKFNENFIMAFSISLPGSEVPITDEVEYGNSSI